MTSLLLAATPAATDIRDIRAAIELPPSIPWLSYGLGAVAILFACWMARLWIRRRRNVEPSPYERAKADLAAAEAAIDTQSPDLFAEQVSGTVRQYVEARFALPATYRTSEEFLADLLNRSDLSPLTKAQPQLSQFLETCDLAKFAGKQLHRDAMQGLSRAAQCFIEAAEHPPVTDPAAVGVAQ